MLSPSTRHHHEINWRVDNDFNWSEINEIPSFLSLSLCPSFQVRSMDQIDKSLQLERFVIERGSLERQLAAGGTAVGDSAI